MVQSQPPVIDIRGLPEGDGAALQRVGQALRGAPARLGLFHVTHHGIPRDDLHAFDETMHALFAMGEAEKAAIRRTRENAWGYYDRELTKNRPDWKEIFDYGPEPEPGQHAPAHSDGRNQWPAGHPEWKTVLIRHFAQCERIALSLLRALCVSLELPADRLDAAFVDHSSYLRLNHYPRCDEPAPPDADWFPEQGRLGVHHHTDAGALTILYQDEVAGLQAWVEDRLVLIEPVPDALTVNLGGMLQVWSNDRLRSPIHRVLAHRNRERFSAPFFLNPRYDTVCEPLLEGPAAAASARFRPVSWAHFRDQRSAGDFADFGAEIQIEDFRIEPTASA